MFYFVVLVVCWLCDSKMMFNGLMMYGDSDTSDFTKDSIGAPSSAGSAASDARTRCLESKLQATLQVLQNKEETVRVQAASLALAEARIAALAAHPALPAHPAHPARSPLYSTRSSADGCCVETADVSVDAHLQDVDQNTVNTLQDNLSLFEELYRESFYECARQEQRAERQRAGCARVRRAERSQRARAAALQQALAAQRGALLRCKDIAVEVDRLKAEISNFLSSSNNDSGMWERTDEPVATELADDLRHISQQLLALRDMLNGDCTCGLEKENTRLKTINDTLQIQLGEFRQRVSDLEAALDDKENVDRRHQNQIKMKECELKAIRQQLEVLEEGSKEQGTTCNTLNLQIQQLQVLLKDRAEELARAQQLCRGHEATISQLRQELGRADNVNKENTRVREEVSSLSAQVCQWREQLSDSQRRLHALEAELTRSREHCQHLERHYRQEARLAGELRAQLREARARGAALCAEARRAASAVRAWLRRQRRRHRDQEEIITEQQKLIRTLQGHRYSDLEHTNTSSDTVDPCCSKRVVRATRRDSCDRERDMCDRERGACNREREMSCSRCSSFGVLGTSNVEVRSAATSTSELSGQSGPRPPRRLRKKPLCVEKHCHWPLGREAPPPPQRSHTNAAACDGLPPARPPRALSPADELLQRVRRT